MLSNRLLTIAKSIDNCQTMVDVGTDHAYLPIYLVREGRVKHAIAVDINKGPLEAGAKRVCDWGLEEKIEMRQGNGLCRVKKGEGEVIVIAGMGGLLIRDIIEGHIETAKSAKLLIVQPQRDSIELRNYLYRNGFETEKETFLKDENKFYEIIWSRYTGKKEDNEQYPISRRLLERPTKDLAEFVNDKIRETKEILADLEGENTDNAQKRLKECEALSNYYKEVEKWLQQNVKG